jgi:hypothetical protein
LELRLKREENILEEEIKNRGYKGKGKEKNKINNKEGKSN